jgi:hypothetical protein
VAVKYDLDQYLKVYIAAAQKAICEYAQKQVDDSVYDIPCHSYEDQIKKCLFIKFCLENIDCYSDVEQDKIISLANQYSRNCGNCLISDAELAAFKLTPKGKELSEKFLDLDPDVARFIEYNGLTDTDQITYTDTFVKALKDEDLWNKFHSIHPFVGPTVTAKAFNLKDPLTFQITWGTGASSVAKGVDFDGTTNGYGDLNLNFVSLGYTTTTDIHISFYTPDANTVTRNIGWGAQSAAGVDRVTMVFDGTGTNYFVDMWSDNQNAGRLTISGDPGDAGYYITSTASVADLRMRRNTTLLGSTVTVRDVNPVPNFDLFIGALDVAGVVTFGTTRTFGIFTTGYNLTDLECDILNGIVDTYLTSLNRK